MKAEHKRGLVNKMGFSSAEKQREYFRNYRLNPSVRESANRRRRELRLERSLIRKAQKIKDREVALSALSEEEKEEARLLNSERVRENRRRYYKKMMSEKGDRYWLNLARYCLMATGGMSGKFFPKELLEVKALQLRLMREIKTRAITS